MKKSSQFIELVRTGLDDAFEKVRQLRLPTGAENGHTESRRLLLGLSGGPDSTALTLALHTVASELALELFACHVNYRLRGAESDADQAFCEKLCERLQIPLTVQESMQMKGEQVDAREEQLRNARYEIFATIASQSNCDFVVTAHTQDDQVETILFRVFRGTALTGLRGIPAARSLDAKLFVLRPMLTVTHEQCLTFLSESSEEARLDSSNQQSEYTRNYIRNEIIPKIESRFPTFRRRIEQLITTVDHDDAFLSKLAQNAYDELSSDSDMDDRWNLQKTRDLDISLLQRVVALAMRSRGVETSFDRVEKVVKLIVSDDETAFSLNENWDVRTKGDGYILWESKNESIEGSPSIVVSEQQLLVPGMTMLLSLGLAIRVETISNQPRESFPHAQSLTALVDLRKCSGPLTVRNEQSDDKIQPFGMPVSVRLKKYLRTHPRSKAARFARFVIADADEVLWIPGVGISEKLRAIDRPTHRLALIPLTDQVELF